MRYRFLYKFQNDLPIYDLHDGKFLLIMLQNSHCARIYHAFLLCRYLKGKSTLEGATYHMWTKQEYIKYVKKSKDQYGRRESINKVKRRNQMKEYDLDAHQKWADQKNRGISHLGVVLEDYGITSD